MKILNETGLARLIAKIKATFIPKSDIVSANTLDIDDTPTNNSNNLVKSGGVKAELDNKMPSSTKYGASIQLNLNTTNYKIQAVLKDQDGNTLASSNEIDLPMESVVTGGRYNNTDKKVYLTLQNGTEISFSVGDLIGGLQTEITTTNKLAINKIAFGGTSSQFLKGDGSYDSNIYLTAITSAMITNALGYTPLQNHQSLANYYTKTEIQNGYQPKITSSNKLSYNLISGTPDLSGYLTNDNYYTNDDDTVDFVFDNGVGVEYIAFHLGNGEAYFTKHHSRIDIPEGNDNDTFALQSWVTTQLANYISKSGTNALTGTYNITNSNYPFYHCEIDYLGVLVEFNDATGYDCIYSHYRNNLIEVGNKEGDWYTNLYFPTNKSGNQTFAMLSDIPSLSGYATTSYVSTYYQTKISSSNKIPYSYISGTPTNISAFTNDSGYITGITSSMVTTALGYTPYNSSNPNGYITSSGSVTGTSYGVRDLGDRTKTIGIQWGGNWVYDDGGGIPVYQSDGNLRPMQWATVKTKVGVPTFSLSGTTLTITDNS